MTEQEIIDGNKLIAEFMGGELYTHAVMKDERYRNLSEYKSHHIDGLKYHSSFDWIIPVVEKIEGLGYQVDIDLFSCYISKLLDDNSVIIDSHEDNKINAVYKAVIQFIQWYNQQK